MITYCRCGQPIVVATTREGDVVQFSNPNTVGIAPLHHCPKCLALLPDCLMRRDRESVEMATQELPRHAN
jgi:hypothetical protein